MEITRKHITNYHLMEKALEKEIKKLGRYKANAPAVEIGKVYGSTTGYPYIQCGFTVGGSDSAEYKRWKEWNAKCRYLEIKIKQDIKHIENLKTEIDLMIANMEDIEDKVIFEYTVEGKSQQWIARKVGLDQSVISRRIKKYVKT